MGIEIASKFMPDIGENVVCVNLVCSEMQATDVATALRDKREKLADDASALKMRYNVVWDERRKTKIWRQVEALEDRAAWLTSVERGIADLMQPKRRFGE